MALWLIREVFKGRVPMDVIFIDTSFHLKTIYEFIDKIAKEWNLNLVIARKDEVLKLIGNDLTVHVDDFSEPMKKILEMSPKQMKRDSDNWIYTNRLLTIKRGENEEEKRFENASSRL